MKQLEPPPPPPVHRKRLQAVGTFLVNKFTSKSSTASFLQLIIIIFLLMISSSYFLGYNFSSCLKTHEEQPAAISININRPQNTISAVDPAAEQDYNRFSTRCVKPAVASEQVRQTILDRVFNGTSPWQNFPPAHVIPLLRPSRIKGWGSNGAVFENLIRKVRPRIIIEVGTFLGASALHMVELTHKLGLHDTQILCIDDFRGWPGFQEEIKFKDMKMLNGDVLLMYQFMQNVVYVNATESIVFVPFSTSSSLEKLCEWGVLGELIEVDAGHDFHSAWSDINKAYKILRSGGVIFGHDYFTSADNKGVRRAVNLFARLNNLTVQLDGQHWVIHSPRP